MGLSPAARCAAAPAPPCHLLTRTRNSAAPPIHLRANLQPHAHTGGALEVMVRGHRRLPTSACHLPLAAPPACCAYTPATAAATYARRATCQHTLPVPAAYLLLPPPPLACRTATTLPYLLTPPARPRRTHHTCHTCCLPACLLPASVFNGGTGGR